MLPECLRVHQQIKESQEKGKRGLPFNKHLLCKKHLLCGWNLISIFIFNLHNNPKPSHYANVQVDFGRTHNSSRVFWTRFKQQASRSRITALAQRLADCRCSQLYLPLGLCCKLNHLMCHLCCSHRQTPKES